MSYQVSISAYDMLTNVHASALVYEIPGGTGHGADLLLHVTCDLAGVGETDPAEWLRDVLVALLEET